MLQAVFIFTEPVKLKVIELSERFPVQPNVPPEQAEAESVTLEFAQIEAPGPNIVGCDGLYFTTTEIEPLSTLLQRFEPSQTDVNVWVTFDELLPVGKSV